MALGARFVLASPEPTAGRSQKFPVEAALLRDTPFGPLWRTLLSHALTNIFRQMTARAVLPLAVELVRKLCVPSHRGIFIDNARTLTSLRFSCPQQALPIAHSRPRYPAARVCAPAWTFARPEHVSLLRAFANTQHREGWTGWTGKSPVAVYSESSTSARRCRSMGGFVLHRKLSAVGHGSIAALSY